MAKTGRNDPCPCGSGSGKKYKQCCLARDEATAATARAAQAAAAPARPPRFTRYLQIRDHDTDELTEASNAAANLVRAGKLDEAERAAHDLLVRFPDVHDGYDRLGMVCEARGNHRQAAEYYRKAIAVIRAHPDDYDPEFEAVFQKLIDRLDPPGADTPA
jgi:tetratricopeptide (TPR) repeat protein